MPEDPVDRRRPSDRVSWGRVAGRFGLSPRQVEVARLLIDGCARKRVSKRLGCSRHTVDTHIRRLYRKVGRHRLDRVIVEILRVGLIDDDE